MSRKSEGFFALLLLGAIVSGVIAIVRAIFSAIASVMSALGAFLVELKWPIVTVLALIASVPLSFLSYEHLYYSRKKFKELKSSISNHIQDCNELNHHISELKCSYANIKSADYGSSSMKDESRFNFKREQWSNEIKNRFVHNCSAAICKSANNQPLKYLCKYFDIAITDESLSNIEEVLNNFSAAEQGKRVLKGERDAIVESIKSSVPWPITRFGRSKLIKRLGFEEIDFSDLYFPIYTFQYVSPGGNSALKCDVKLDIENLDNLVSYMRGLIVFAKSVEGQRALMTSRLREEIKARDNFTCKLCGISAHTTKHLLLEIDHVIPLSKGGITSEKNLQTLCWKCNRSKGSKIVHV